MNLQHCRGFGLASHSTSVATSFTRLVCVLLAPFFHVRSQHGVRCSRSYSSVFVLSVFTVSSRLSHQWRLCDRNPCTATCYTGSKSVRPTFTAITPVLSDPGDWGETHSHKRHLFRVSTNLTEQISRFPGDSRRDMKKNPGHVCIAMQCIKSTSLPKYRTKTWYAQHRAVAKIRKGD